MSRRFTPKVVTANRLREGDVVYLAADDRWTPHHHEAELIEDEAHAQLRLLHAASQRLEVVGAYLADAKAGAIRFARPSPFFLFSTRHGPPNRARRHESRRGKTTNKA